LRRTAPEPAPGDPRERQGFDQQQRSVGAGDGRVESRAVAEPHPRWARHLIHTTTRPARPPPPRGAGRTPAEPPGDRERSGDTTMLHSALAKAGIVSNDGAASRRADMESLAARAADRQSDLL